MGGTGRSAPRGRPRLFLLLSGQTQDGLNHIGADVQSFLLDPFKHRSHQAQMPFLLGKWEEAKRPADRNRKGGGAFPGGEIVEDRLEARMTKRPSQHLTLASAKIPIGHDGLQVSRVVNLLMPRAGEPLAGRIAFGPGRDLLRNGSRYDERLGESAQDVKEVDLSKNDQGRGINDSLPRHGPALARADQGMSGRETL